MSKLNIIKSNIKDGIISKDINYFPNLKTEEINLLYETNLNKYLNKLNLSKQDIVLIDDDNIEEGYLILKEGKVICFLQYINKMNILLKTLNSYSYL